MTVSQQQGSNTVETNSEINPDQALRLVSLGLMQKLTNKGLSDLNWLREDVNEWFKMNEESPYMLLVAEVLDDKKIKMSEEEKKLFGIEKLNVKRSDIPAVTHVDYSARIQTVSKKNNPKYFKLLKKFKEKTGCPVLINTSFNVRGEPIVNTPIDAFNCFMGTSLDILVIGNSYLRKENQNKKLKKNYEKKYELD